MLINFKGKKYKWNPNILLKNLLITLVILIVLFGYLAAATIEYNYIVGGF